MQHWLSIEQELCKRCTWMWNSRFIFKRETPYLQCGHISFLVFLRAKALALASWLSRCHPFYPCHRRLCSCLWVISMWGEERLHSTLLFAVSPPWCLYSAHCCSSALVFPSDWWWLSHLDWHFKIGILQNSFPFLYVFDLSYASFIKFFHLIFKMKSI